MYMKKYLIFALAALLLAGCQKNNRDNSQKPVITWEANEKFSEMEIARDMDAKVTLSVPEGVASFKIEMNIPSTLIGLANKMISLASNKGTTSRPPVLDLVNDATAASELARIAFLSGAPKTGTSFTLDFAHLLEYLAGDSVMENASKFSFALSLMDQAENTLSKNVRFNWTSAPETVFNPENAEVNLKATSPSLTMAVTAPGKLAKVTLTFDSLDGGKADSGIINYIKSFTKGDAVLDLVENASVAKALGLPSGADVKDKTRLSIDFSSLLFALALQASEEGSNTLLVIELEDALGKIVVDGVLLKN